MPKINKITLAIVRMDAIVIYIDNENKEMAMINVTYIKKTTLQFSDLWNHFGMTKDNGGRWEPSESTQGYAIEFLSEIRSPSRAWPLSYAKSMLSQKFAKLVVKEDPDLALKLGIAEEASY